MPRDIDKRGSSADRGRTAARYALPSDRTHAHPDRPFETADDESSMLSRRSERHLLVIDDDDTDRERIRRYINKFKLPVVIHEASSGAQAMRLLAAESIDLLLLDYQLPDMTGTELINELSRIDGIRPTIMITGVGNETAAVEAFRLGVVDYLSKHSMTPESLTATVECALRTIDLEKKLHTAQDRLQRLSLYDSLTGLPNRNLFFDRINQATLRSNRHDGNFSLLMIDLNLFKQVNDSLGHLAGDHVLTVVGQRLREAARESDTYARIGGDEFACILHDIATSDSAIACAEAIHSAICRPIPINGQLVQIGASIGIARYPEHGSDATTLMSNADNAMYAAKKTHRKYALFSQDTSVESSRDFPVGQHLYQAVRENELFLEYQPKIDVKTQAILGVEALVRWNSPTFGLIMPNDFIPEAERSNLIEAITYWTIDTAFSQLAQWQRAGLRVPLALNLSARMLDDDSFPANLRDRLAANGLSGEDLTLEITETALASSSTTIHRVLSTLREMGVMISIDDFGSGFTSFRSVRDIPFTELKVDRTFIEHLRYGSRDAAILRSILALAERLGMRAVAEGVETNEQLGVLESLGCNCVQGYGIARPMSANAIATWIETHRADKLH